MLQLFICTLCEIFTVVHLTHEQPFNGSFFWRSSLLSTPSLLSKLIFVDLFYFLFLLDDCRKIEFKDQMHHKALINHVIRIYHRIDIDVCELNCFLEPNCRSYNYGESGDGLFVCELSDVHHSQGSDGELEARIDFKYVAINEVNLILRSKSCLF